MNNRQNISSGAPWENQVGYSRAVRIGNQIEVSGTVGIKDGEPVYKDDPYGQTKACLEIISEVLNKAGASMHNIIRTRIYVTNIAMWEEVGRAHGEYFKEIKPATSMIEVSALIDPDYLVEIEATAIVE